LCPNNQRSIGCLNSTGNTMQATPGQIVAEFAWYTSTVADAAA
jgi:hypothetical protein